MLADKFWLNPDSKIIWVSDTHMKTVIDNPETFEFKNEQQLKKIIENVIIKFKHVVKCKNINEFYKFAKNNNYTNELLFFEDMLYTNGYVWAEHTDDKILLKSNDLNFLREAIDDLRIYLDSIKEIEMHMLLRDQKIIINILRGKQEIDLFLNEMILPRKAKYAEQPKQEENNIKLYSLNTVGKKPNFIKRTIKKIINKIYA